ncbi:tyrosine-type recombinase/integrase [Aliarcobacter butzleri]|uniref:tyrosine-type recombinase/integrase n=1 Tax=Aliarcobacter butzleri TaxID=28197 RepID=UPI002B242098|nr:tyrosine-type recombinase/integrase [Aliarcobacter butzleri]
MAVDRKQFIEAIDIGLKSNKTFDKFYFNFKVNNKLYSKIFDYTNKKEWDKKTRISKAKTEAIAYKQNKINPKTELDENIKFDTFISMHFEKLPNTSWSTTKIKHYNNYLKNHLGNKKVMDIKQMHIKECIREQEEKNLAPRTIKTTIELLNPVFKEAIANRLIDYNPCIGITIKLPKTKKIVLNASEQLSEIHKTIHEVFKNNPFYLSFYLFALQGRRKSEILNLKWQNIDFNNDIYLLEDTKNGEHQLFSLPKTIKDELLKFKDVKGWIYTSSINSNERISNIEKQTAKLKKILPNFTLHFMRNILVSAMAEQGIAKIGLNWTPMSE